MGCCKDKKPLNKKLEEIYIGWKNYVFPSEKVELIAKLRAPICVTCIHKVYDLKKMKRIPQCELCGCPVHAKIRNPESECPADPPKWLKHVL